MFNNLIMAYQVVMTTDVISEDLGFLTPKEIEKKINRFQGFVAGYHYRGLSYGLIRLKREKKFRFPRRPHQFSKHSFGSKNI